MKPFSMDEHIKQFAKTVFEAEEAERLRILSMAFEAGRVFGVNEEIANYNPEDYCEPDFAEWLQARLVEASGA